MGVTEAAYLILARAKTAAELGAALEAIPSGPRLRDVLLERYDQLARQPKKDPGAELRATLLDALRPLATAADRDLLERAALTFEFGWGTRPENASRLRGAALLGLNQLDPALADWYAVRLLADQHTEAMSGEPALTAVRLLAAHGQVQPLYLLALGGSGHPEAVAESVRSLQPAPAAAVSGLADLLWERGIQPEIVALVDLATTHPDAAAFAPFMRRLLLRTDDLDLLRFAAAQSVASRRPVLVRALTEAAEETTEPDRRQFLREALSLA